MRSARLLLMLLAFATPVRLAAQEAAADSVRMERLAGLGRLWVSLR